MDLIIADPPFGIKFNGKEKFYNRKGENVVDGYVECDEVDYYKFSKRWIEAAVDKMKDDGVMYVFSGWTNVHHVMYALENAGLEIVNQIVWQYAFGVHNKNKYITSHYNILYCRKKGSNAKVRRFARNEGSRESYHDRCDVWAINREYRRNEKKAPTKIPDKVISKIIAYSSDEGDSILDPFVGSGTTLRVARQMNRNSIGIEKSEEIYNFCKENIRETESG